MFRLEVGFKEYMQSIVNAHHIHYETKIPERSQRIAHAYASYRIRHAELMEEIYENDVEANENEVDIENRK